MKHPGKVFGIGLSRTGTRSLTAALHTLGFDTVHYPIDSQTLSTLVRGDANFPLLEHYDGITDITTIPFIEDLDARFPNSKFILTLRDEDEWLKSCSNHWGGRSAFADHQGEASDEHHTHMEVRRFLRAAVYGSYEFEKTRFANARRRHIEFAQNYFRSRPEQLLTLNIAEGDGWEKLAAFLGCEQPNTPFPHKGKRLSEKLAAQNAVLDTNNLEIDD